MKKLSFVLAIILGIFTYSNPAQADSNSCSKKGKYSTRIISVTGKGIVKASPDMAIVNFAIVTLGKTPEAARSENAKISKEVLNAAKKAKVKEKDTRLEVLNVYEKTEYRSGKRHKLGYEATREFSVDLYELDKLPELISSVINSGANRLSNVQYSIKDKDSVRNEALQKAVKDAKSKAELMLDALGRESLGKILVIDEEYFNNPSPMRFRGGAMFAKAETAAEPEAFAQGDLEYSASIKATFSLQD